MVMALKQMSSNKCGALVHHKQIKTNKQKKNRKTKLHLNIDRKKKKKSLWTES